MRQLALLVVIAALGGCASLPSPVSSTVVVDGQASLKFLPDEFLVQASFRTRNANQAEGLAELSRKLTAARGAISTLAGLRTYQFDATEMTLKAVQDTACVQGNRYGSDETCPVTGRFGSIDINITGTPSASAGAAVSILSELGAETVSLSGYSLSNPAEATQKAIEAAVADARSKANAIAAASGKRVSAIVKVQYGSGFTQDQYGGMAMAVLLPDDAPPGVVTQSTTRPITDLTLDPREVTVDAKVIAEFAIE